jgi:hypothetical protein
MSIWFTTIQPFAKTPIVRALTEVMDDAILLPKLLPLLYHLDSIQLLRWQELSKGEIWNHGLHRWWNQQSWLVCHIVNLHPSLSTCIESFLGWLNQLIEAGALVNCCVCVSITCIEYQNRSNVLSWLLLRLQFVIVVFAPPNWLCSQRNSKATSRLWYKLVFRENSFSSKNRVGR